MASSNDKLNRFNTLYKQFEKNKIDQRTFRQSLSNDLGITLTPR